MLPRPILSARVLRQLSKEAYICPICLLRAGSSASTHQPRQSERELSQQGRRTYSRHAIDEVAAQPNKPARIKPRLLAQSTPRRRASNGSLASSTAVNAPTSVPHKYRELHQSLLALQETANSYVDRSRLQLALRSLESDRPVVRIAFLGLGQNGLSAARKLAWALLSDALSEEEPWESELLASMDDGRSLSLKYGDPEAMPPNSPLVRTMNVPSRYLERNNLEILITPLNANRNVLHTDVEALEDAVIVPSLTTPNTSAGGVGFVRFPVHKSVIVTEGITGAIEYGKFPSSLADSKLIKAAVSVPTIRPAGQNGNESESKIVDVDLATHALELFRTNKANGAQFSKEWQTSRISSLSEWIAGSKSSSTLALNQATANLISSVLSRASKAVAVADDVGTALAVGNTLPDPEREGLQSAVTEWAADSHRDLQTHLDTAFAASASWRRTVWWRLFWRIDDVAVSASDVLRQSWLTEAEQRLAFLSGRIIEAGVATVDQLHQLQQSTVVEEPAPLRPGELSPMPSIISTLREQNDRSTPFDFPWPPAISLSRLYMLNTLVPGFHHKAQGLLLSTLSTIAGSSALATWFYFATAGVALYESGAILSLGLVWSLRRLQNRWEKERTEFAVATREDARRVLGEVEGHLRRLVQDGGRAIIDPEDVRSWLDAREAIKKCQEALERAT